VAVVGNSLNTLTTAQQPAQRFDPGFNITKFVWTINNAQPASGSLVLTIMKGNALGTLADTAAVITIAASAVAGEYSWTGTLAVASGEYLVIKVVNNASANSAQDGGSSITIERTLTLS
jgi:hypothetical protein